MSSGSGRIKVTVNFQRYHLIRFGIQYGFVSVVVDCPLKKRQLLCHEGRHFSAVNALLQSCDLLVVGVHGIYMEMQRVTPIMEKATPGCGPVAWLRRCWLTICSMPKMVETSAIPVICSDLAEGENTAAAPLPNDLSWNKSGIEHQKS